MLACKMHCIPRFMNNLIYIGMVSNSPKEGIVVYIPDKNLPMPMVEKMAEEAAGWILENNLVENDHFVYDGDCTIVMSRDGTCVRTIFHGIRFLVPELETAFRLRFLCK